MAETKSLRPFFNDNGEPVSFPTLMELEPLGGDNQDNEGQVRVSRYRSKTAGFQPGAPMDGGYDRPRTYGGHVYAQSVWAAAQTVPVNANGEATYIVGSVTGFFLKGGTATESFVYAVRALSDGRSYVVRTVEVTQESSRGVVFSCTVSFKKIGADAGAIEFQDRLRDRYADVLDGKAPWDHPKQLSTENPSFRDSAEARRKAWPFPGLQTTKVDMEAYNSSRPPSQQRRLGYYGALGGMPSVRKAPNLHACAHLYGSDRNSLFAVISAFNIAYDCRAVASLNHTVIFHVGAEVLAMLNDEDAAEETSGQDGNKAQRRERWFLQEAWTDRLGDGRGVHHSRIWDERGRHIATTVQDGMIRLGFEDAAEEERARRDIEGGRAKI